MKSKGAKREPCRTPYFTIIVQYRKMIIIAFTFSQFENQIKSYIPPHFSRYPQRVASFSWKSKKDKFSINHNKLESVRKNSQFKLLFALFHMRNYFIRRLVLEAQKFKKLSELHDSPFSMWKLIDFCIVFHHKIYNIEIIAKEK